MDDGSDNGRDAGRLRSPARRYFLFSLAFAMRA